MMELMSRNPFCHNDLESKSMFDMSFEDIMHSIALPLKSYEHENEPTMKQIFVNSFREEDDPNEDDEIDQDSDSNGDINIISPKKFDIVCGKDKLSRAHVGNKRFRAVIEMNRERYQTAPTRDDKTQITCEIIAMIRSCQPGGRFLKFDTDTNQWIVLGDEYAREKVSHALRSVKDPLRKKIRKTKRTSVQTMYPEDENDVFAALLHGQKRIFEMLVQQEEEEQRDRTTNKRLRLDSDSSDEN